MMAVGEVVAALRPEAFESSQQVELLYRVALVRRHKITYFSILNNFVLNNLV